MKHELKILPPYFEAVLSGEKTFEIRNNNDRGFEKGDTLVLREFDPELSCKFALEGYTGRTIERVVSYVSNYEQQPGFVVLGLRQQRLPEGWQLVPVEPTEEMKEAGLLAALIESDYCVTYLANEDEVYSAMLAAAPKPEGGAA